MKTILMIYNFDNSTYFISIVYSVPKLENSLSHKSLMLREIT